MKQGARVFLKCNNKHEDIKVFGAEKRRRKDSEGEKREDLLVCMCMRVHACIRDCTSGSPKSEVPEWPYLALHNILTLSLPPSLCVSVCACMCAILAASPIMLCLNMRELFETRESCMRGSNNLTYTNTVKYTHRLQHAYTYNLTRRHTHTHTVREETQKMQYIPPYCSD